MITTTTVTSNIHTILIVHNTTHSYRYIYIFIQIVNKEITVSGTSTTVSGQLVNLGEVKCQLDSASRRRKRSTTTETSVVYYLVSVSNNDANYSAPVPVIIYNPSCNTCTISNSLVICELRVCI